MPKFEYVSIPYSLRMKSKHLFIGVFLLAVVVRFLLNFSIELIPGAGGGYSIVQIREIIEEGHLAMSDMPLVFYFNSLVVKIIISIFPNCPMDNLIINVYKIIDCIALPLLLIPLYRIQKDIFKYSYSKIFLAAVAGFAVLSYAPIELASDAQKNSIGLVFMTAFIYSFLKYLKGRSVKDLLLSVTMLILTGLAHFGTFTLSVCFLLLALVLFYRWKAIIPVIGLGITAVLLIAVFDPSRAKEMLTFWLNSFSVFLSPRLLYYPHGIFNYISAFVIIWFIIRILRKNKAALITYDRRILLLFMIFIAILAFPFFRFEYGRRLGLMLFVPQSIVLFVLYPYFSKRAALIIAYFVLALTVFTATIRVASPKPLAITGESYSDLMKIKDELKDPDTTIIFVRHGLEWWLIWEFRVKIAQPHIQVNEELVSKYDHIFFLIQKKGENDFYPGRSSPFRKPQAPEAAVLVYDSGYFEMYELGED